MHPRIAANNVFVHESLYQNFFDTFADRAQALRLGDPLDEQTELGPMINPQHVERLNGLVRDARRRGAAVVQSTARPNAGFKHSGLGREGGMAGLDEFCEWQTLSITRTS